MLAGPVEFEHGQCQFKLMTVNEKIVDVEPWSRQMPIHWYDQPPAAIDEYIERSHALLRALVAADIQAAHHLFSRRYDDEVTPELLSRLSQQWRDDYGQTITQLSYKGSDFGDAAQDSTAKRLSVDSIVEFEGGARCMARVDFTIPVGQNAIARAHLSAVNLRPSWQSVAPQLDIDPDRQPAMHRRGADVCSGRELAEFAPPAGSSLTANWCTRTFLEHGCKADWQTADAPGL